eukprot:9493787-Pyramimonas_sp.AAC.1
MAVAISEDLWLSATTNKPITTGLAPKPPRSTWLALFQARGLTNHLSAGSRGSCRQRERYDFKDHSYLDLPSHEIQQAYSLAERFRQTLGIKIRVTGLWVL